MLRIGVISDTHWRARRQVMPGILEAFKGIDHILHCGDITGEEILEMLEEIAPVSAVCGNCDDHGMRSFLPEKRVVELEGVRFGLIHGWGRSEDYLPQLRAQFREIDALVFGHWHRRYNAVRGGVLFFNPGSPSSGGEPSVGILEVDGAVRARHVFL